MKTSKFYLENTANSQLPFVFQIAALRQLEIYWVYQAAILNNLDRKPADPR
jgi:hypothetical protein